MASSAAIRHRDGAEGIIQRRSGVEVVSACWSEWEGFDRCILKLRWLTEPGWIELEHAEPSLYAVVEEVGGRCDFRSNPNCGHQGDYFGTDQATLVAGGEPVIIHAYQLRQMTAICCVKSTGGTADQVAARAIARSPTRLMIRNRPLRECARLFGPGVADDPNDLFAAALSRSVLLAWADAARREPDTKPALSGELLRRVFAYIDDELDESAIRSHDLAALADMSPAQFGRDFQQATGQSPQAWQMDTRVRNAQRLMLDEPGGSLAEFATLCGFADQSHFSRAFLKVVGQSPTEWLNRFK